MIVFKKYDKTEYAQNNLGYLKKAKKLGVTINESLPKISEEEMKDFLNDKYYDEILPVAPVASCSVISSSDIFHKALQEKFDMKTFIIYGYIDTFEQKYHRFTDSDIEVALKNKTIFNNHHAWIMFENGQLLDITFLNTLKYALKVEEDIFEFILTDSTKVFVPKSMEKKNPITNSSYFKYIPMYHGKLFPEDPLINSAPKGIYI